jgi:hypothetical protein
VCDVCLAVQRQRAPHVSDADWAAIVEHLQEH